VSDEPPYEVGHGRPPMHSRFKKGQSGNPRGRPRKSAAAVDLDALAAPVEVVVNGHVRRMHPTEVALRGILKRAVSKRSLRSITYLLDLFLKHDAIELGIVEHRYGVLELPTNIFPNRMISAMRSVYGFPPWTKKQIAIGRAAYLRDRTEQEAAEDEVMDYFDLATGALRIELPSAPTPKLMPTPRRRRNKRPKLSADDREIVQWFACELHDVGGRRKITTVQLLFHTLRAEGMANERAHKFYALWLERLKPSAIEGGYLVVSAQLSAEKFIALMEVRNRFAKPPPEIDQFYDLDD